jgi:hypothetical protein
MKCSQAALDLIWQEETGGDAYYAHTNECRANWPGGASGVTVGGFYDLGYVTNAEQEITLAELSGETKH